MAIMIAKIADRLVRMEDCQQFESASIATFVQRIGLIATTDAASSPAEQWCKTPLPVNPTRWWCETRQ